MADMKFEWDPLKNVSNKRNHKISFEEAILVFSDRFALSIFDIDSSESEDRWVTIGFIPTKKIIVVIHTDRMIENNNSIRIISARKATKNETLQYIKRKGK